jgi:hypothetical protein
VTGRWEVGGGREGGGRWEVGGDREVGGGREEVGGGRWGGVGGGRCGSLSVGWRDGWIVTRGGAFNVSELRATRGGPENRNAIARSWKTYMV